MTVERGVGRSGGLMCLWDPDKLKGNILSISDNVINILFSCRDSGIQWIRLNVYGPSSLIAKATLWNTLSLMRNQFKGEIWMVAEAFNAILYPL